VRRRDVIRAIAGAAAWPIMARAQPAERVRHVGVLMPFVANDPEAQARSRILEQSLGELGWTVGRDLQIDYRAGGGELAIIRRYAVELAALAPDVIVAVGSATIGPVQQAAGSIPIIFVNVVDPVGSGFVQSLARPGGNVTGFTNFEYSMSGKWVELLKQIMPQMVRVAVLRDPTTAAGIGQFSAIQAVAQPLGIELTPLNVRDTGEIERGIAAFARLGKGGLIVTSSRTAFRRDLFIKLAARHKLPAVYPYRYYAEDGGLLSYGPDPHDMMRHAAAYIDRILKGDKPAEMPVQSPTKYQLVINLRTAKALGIAIPAPLLARADEVME
jgi:putative ABC transport system substrate-binding protein